MGGTNGRKETMLGVNVFTAPGKTMVGERPKPFGEAFGFDPITSTLIFGEYDAVLVDAMGTVAEAEALADWIALTSAVSTLPKGLSFLSWLDDLLYLPEVLYVVFFIWLVCSGPGKFSVDYWLAGKLLR
jgi:hypothetical protein